MIDLIEYQRFQSILFGDHLFGAFLPFLTNWFHSKQLIDWQILKNTFDSFIWNIIDVFLFGIRRINFHHLTLCSFLLLYLLDQNLNFWLDFDLLWFWNLNDHVTIFTLVHYDLHDTLTNTLIYKFHKLLYNSMEIRHD